MVAMPPVCNVSTTLTQARAAIGGSAWVRVAETDATGSATVAGLTGTARFQVDTRRRRYAEQFDLPVMGHRAELYDGTLAWDKDLSGGVHPYDAAFERERARTDGFIKSSAYIDPRSGASYRCMGLRDEHGRSVVVVRVTPPRGIAAELTLDTRTHLLASMSVQFPTTTRVTRFDDYRTVGDVVLPFAITEGTAAEPADGFAFRVAHYALRTNVDATDFKRPRATPNASIVGGKSSITVPLQVEGRQLLVWASINGRASWPFILDTGGHAILTREAATSLGLRSSGAGESGGAGAGTIGEQYTRVRSLQIGGARLADQPMLVIPYPYSFSERGRRRPLAGILGLEFFERFLTRIDYGQRVLTLSLLPNRRPSVPGDAIPIHFQDDMPLIDAAADHRAGPFGVDTGNAGTVILFGTFLKRTGLDNVYRNGTLVIGHGTGGSNTGRLAILKSFGVGKTVIHQVPADFTNMQRGAFSSWTEAGNLGYEILSRFVPTFDYAHEMLYLDRCKRNCMPRRNTTGLSFSKDVPGSFVVTNVALGTPAAHAGIVTGDRIVAVNEIPAVRFSRADLADRVSRASGTLRLTVTHRGATGTRVMQWPSALKP